jgi:hypothetical protein
MSASDVVSAVLALASLVKATVDDAKVNVSVAASLYQRIEMIPRYDV